MSDPSEAVFLEDLRLGGQVVWGELSYILYGKKRHFVDQYRQLAAQGKWEEARAASANLDDIRTFLEDVMLWKIVETATYAGTIATIKVWFEHIGLHGGRVIPPVREMADSEKEQVRARLSGLGV